MFATQELLIVNENCRAGCIHCPYGRNEPQPLKSLEILIQQVASSPARLILLSGGEPLEYPFLVDLFRQIYTPFRIATGGHVEVAAFLPYLQQHRFFTGFSVGTDVMISCRNNNQTLKDQWLKNLRTLVEYRVSYSLTITVGRDIDLEALIALLYHHQVIPQFFMLSSIQGEVFADEEWNAFVRCIQTVYPNKIITTGYRECKLA